MPKCIIVAAGDFVETTITINSNDLIIAVDGGYLNLIKLGIKPTVVIGDFDSLEQIPTDVSTITHPTVKDETDLALALKYGLAEGFDEFLIYGALGGRIEHSLANIQLLHDLRQKNKKACLINGNQRMEVLCNETLELSAEYKGYISIFALSERTCVTLKGLKYQLNNYVITNVKPIGIDNEFIGKKALIDVHNGSILVIYYF